MITLQHETGVTATVNADGAFVESLTLADGTAVLFERQDMPNGKNRGGIPVCAPVFGPGEMAGLKQHGFARNVTWQVDEQTKSQVKLSLDNPASQVKELPPMYAGCGMELTVELLGDELRETLTIRNIGVEAIMVNPGFHPYFPVVPGESAKQPEVIIDGRSYQFDADQLQSTVKVDSISSSAELKAAQGTWTVIGEGLPYFCIWSESPDQFICVEPTESGYLTDAPASELQPNETKIVSMTIRFSPIAAGVSV